MPHAEFFALDLEVHALLRDIPPRDVSAVDLPGGGDARTAADVSRLMDAARGRRVFRVRVLVALRRFVGRVLRWDGDPPYPARSDSAVSVSAAHALRSHR